MLPISKILVPVDLSERSRGILPYAKAFASRYGAQLTLMHVVTPFFVIPATAVSGPALIPVPDSAVVEKTKELEEWAPGQLEGVEVRRVVIEGDPVAQIAAFAASEDIDLVTISTRGYGVLRRFLIGSTAAKLLHDLACTVLTGVHLAESPRAEPVKVARIVCAIDFGAQTESTLSYASQLAQDFQAGLAVVHVIPALEPKFDVQGSREFASQAMEKAREKLRDAVEEAGAMPADIHVDQGAVAQTVCSFAQAAGADLMVIGRGSQEGSTGRLRTDAYAIIRQSPCPVLSV